MLPKHLNSKPFSYKDAVAAQLSRRALKQMLDDGQIEKVAKGIYRAINPGTTEEDNYRAATLIVGTRSAVCLLSALSEYRLTDTIPKQTWLMVDAEKRSREKSIRLIRARNPKWVIGIKKRTGYSITSIERTIIEVLCSKTPGIDAGLSALKLALQMKLTSPAKLSEMAKRLGVFQRLLPYLRALT